MTIPMDEVERILERIENMARYRAVKRRAWLYIGLMAAIMAAGIIIVALLP